MKHLLNQGILKIHKIFLMFIVITYHLLQPKTTRLWVPPHQLLAALHGILFLVTFLIMHYETPFWRLE
jgi:hypothetical protein